MSGWSAEVLPSAVADLVMVRASLETDQGTWATAVGPLPEAGWLAVLAELVQLHPDEARKYLPDAPTSGGNSNQPGGRTLPEPPAPWNY